MGVLYHQGMRNIHNSLVKTLTNTHNIQLYKLAQVKHIIKYRINNYNFLWVLSYLKG